MIDIMFALKILHSENNLVLKSIRSYWVNTPFLHLMFLRKAYIENYLVKNIIKTIKTHLWVYLELET